MENPSFKDFAKKGFVQGPDGNLTHISKLTGRTTAKIHKLPNLLERAIPETSETGGFLLPTGERVVIKYRFDVNPCPAPRMTQSDKWKKRPIVERYFAFRDKFRHQCTAMGYELSDVLDVIFIIPFPKSYSDKKRKLLNNQKHQLRPDRDNYLKAVQDSFSVDDGFVWDGRTIKLWGEKGQILIF